MSVDREDLDRLEESMYDCWRITSDIKNILDVSENIEDDVRALMKVYDVQFKVLQNNVDHVDAMTEHLEEEQIEMFEGENVGC